MLFGRGHQKQTQAGSREFSIQQFFYLAEPILCPATACQSLDYTAPFRHFRITGADSADSALYSWRVHHDILLIRNVLKVASTRLFFYGVFI